MGTEADRILHCIVMQNTSTVFLFFYDRLISITVRQIQCTQPDCRSLRIGKTVESFLTLTRAQETNTSTQASHLTGPQSDVP